MCTVDFAQCKIHSAHNAQSRAEHRVHSGHSGLHSLIPNAELGLVAVCPLLGMTNNHDKKPKVNTKII